MSTREIYFKMLMSTELPMGLAHYIYTDANNIIQIGKSIPLHFSTNSKVVEQSIDKMKVIESTEGFMFWAVSCEGEKFLNENSKEIGQVLANSIIIQK